MMRRYSRLCAVACVLCLVLAAHAAASAQTVAAFSLDKHQSLVRTPLPLREPTVDRTGCRAAAVAALGDGQVMVLMSGCGPRGVDCYAFAVGVDSGAVKPRNLFVRNATDSINPDRDMSLAIAGILGGRIETVYGTTSTPSALFACTSRGLYRITEGDVVCWDHISAGSEVRPAGTVGLSAGSAPVPVQPTLIASDASGDVWLGASPVGDGRWAGLVLWRSPEALACVEGRLRPAADTVASWQGHPLAIAGAADGPGLWVYGPGADGRTGLTRVPAPQAGTIGQAHAVPPAAEACVAPGLDAPLLAASGDGRVYLTGDTLDGARAFAFDGQEFSDCTPPPDLLRGRRFTALQTDAAGKLCATTDGVGVLVYDGEAWSSHPINEHLPEIAGTGLRRVYCLTFDRDGNLWVGMDDTVVCWRPNE